MTKYSITPFEMTSDAAPINEVFTQYEDFKVPNSNLRRDFPTEQDVKTLAGKDESSNNIMNYIMSTNVSHTKKNGSENQSNNPENQSNNRVEPEGPEESEGPVPVESSSELINHIDDSNIDLQNNINDVGENINNINSIDNLISDSITEEDSSGGNLILNNVDSTQNIPKVDDKKNVEQEVQVHSGIQLLRGDIDNIYYELEKLKTIINQIKSDTFMSKINTFLEDHNKNIIIMLTIFIVLIYFILHNKKTIPVVYKT